MAFKICLSMSFSGALLILILFLGKPFLKNRVSRQWQYYIWLIVILRLLLPFGPETNLMGKAGQTMYNELLPASPASSALLREQPVSDIRGFAPVLLFSHIWLITAFGMLVRRVTIYQSFMRYVNVGSDPVSDIEILDRLSVIAGQAGVKKPTELYVNHLISSPMLAGFFRPCIILPDIDISEDDFLYIAMHELTHYKRRDMLYKWLVQITVCLHWFNPLIHLMCREITKECEFSCDEAVLKKTGYDHAGEYGKTLINAMAAVGKYKENLGAVTLSENKRLLKERLGAIMHFKKKSKTIQFLTGILTLGIILGAFFVGIYSVTSTSDTNRVISGKASDTGKGADTGKGTDAGKGADTGKGADSDQGADTGKGANSGKRADAGKESDSVHPTEHDNKTADHSLTDAAPQPGDEKQMAANAADSITHGSDSPQPAGEIAGAEPIQEPIRQATVEEPYNGAAEEPLQNQVDAAGEASGNAENEVAQNSVISEVPPYIPDTMPMEEIGMDEATQNALDQMGLLTENGEFDFEAFGELPTL